MPDTYQVNITCHNCEHHGTAEIPKGTAVPARMTCPNCGCETAFKSCKPAELKWDNKRRHPYNLIHHDDIPNLHRINDSVPPGEIRCVSEPFQSETERKDFEDILNTLEEHEFR